MNKIIVADTSCLITLSNINQLDILHKLFSNITITKTVEKEFGEILPNWIKTQEVKNKKLQAEIEKHLDKGEASAIVLALEKKSLLIIDEKKGRKIASSYDISIIGTIGLILLAEKRGIVNNALAIIIQLTNKGFRISDKLLNQLINKLNKE